MSEHSVLRDYWPVYFTALLLGGSAALLEFFIVPEYTAIVAILIAGLLMTLLSELF